jgi:hypothetical protein
MKFSRILKSIVVFFLSGILIYCFWGCNKQQEVNLVTVLNEINGPISLQRVFPTSLAGLQITMGLDLCVPKSMTGDRSG